MMAKTKNTKKPVKKIYRLEPGICPMCGNEQLNYYDTEYNDNTVGYNYTCDNDKCNFEGIEWSIMEFDTHTDADGNPIKR